MNYLNLSSNLEGSKVNNKEKLLVVGFDLSQDNPELQHVARYVSTDNPEEAARIFCEEVWESPGWSTTRGNNRFIDDFVQVSSEPRVWSDKYSRAQIFVIPESEVRIIELSS